jgi:hypothetical protein
MLNKDQLCFDPAETDDNNDSVGAYVRSSDGTLITHTTTAGKERLDVDAAIRAADGTALGAVGDALKVNVEGGSVSTELDGIYNVTTNADPDNVGIIAHTRAASLADAQQVERTTAASPNADDLDPANIVGLDVNSFMMAWDGSGWDRLTMDADGLEVSAGPIKFLKDGVETVVNEDTVNSANNEPLPVKLTSITGDINITANDLNVAISHLNDSTRIGDGVELVEVTTNNDMQVVDRANSGISTASKTIGDTEAAIFDTVLTERKKVIIQNRDKSPMEVGPAGFVAGLIIPGKSSLTLEIGPGIAIVGKRAAGKSGSIHVMQLA